MTQANYQGEWVDFRDAYIQENGVWRDTREMYVRKDGTWQTVWKPASLLQEQNMIRFSRNARQALIVDGQNNNKTTWYGSSLLNTGVVEFNGQVHLYFRGYVGTDNSRHAVGLWRQDAATFNAWSEWTEEPSYILHPDDVTLSGGVTWNGTGNRRLANPVACVHNGEIYLYTILNGADGTGTGINAWAPTVLWKSTDGVNFTQIGFLKDADDGFTNTIHTGGLGVVHDGTQFIMVSSAQDDDGFGYRKILRTSADGLNWSTAYWGAFPAPDTLPNRDFDDESSVTCRLYVEDGYVYAFIPGGGVHEDYPEAVALYRQTIANVDSAPWEEYAHNPVLMRGDAGSVDEGAIWSPTVIELKGRLHMFYEGCGAYGYSGGSPESNSARDTAYGGYGVTNFSSICYAPMVGNRLGDKWAQTPLVPGQTYRIRNVMNGGWLRYRGTADFDLVETTLDPNATNLDWVIDKDNEFFIFRCASAPTQILEVQGVSRTNDAECQVFVQGTGDNRQQEWHVDEIGSDDGVGGIFVIRNRNSGMCLNSSAGFNLTLASDGGTARQRNFLLCTSQQWRLIRQ